MIFGEVSAAMYRYIVEAEFLFLRHFKMNPFEVMAQITMLDLVSYMQILEKKTKRESESVQKKDFEKALVQLRDLLIFMTMGKEGLRLKL